jgi:predicted CXXCH cytochrome family protein
VDNTTYVPSDVSLTAPGMNKSANALRAHWSTSGAISAAERQSCAACHDNHGSEYQKLIGVRNVFTGTNRINSTAITGNDNSVCYACHTTASTGYPLFTRLANGYPNTGTWPGSATYTNATYGIHNKPGVVWPGSGYTGGDCKNCHDVHGTANTYDVLRGTHTQASFGTCFTCHNGAVAGAANVYQWYPQSTGGQRADGTNRYGHKGTDGGTPSDRPQPCYNCHNPHGSTNTYGLQVVTQTGPATTISVTSFGAGAYVRTNAGQVRRFCFTCHIPRDTNNGWNGSAYAAVAAGANVDGFDRLTQLKITQGNQAHSEASTATCYQCHDDAHYPL